MKAFYAHHYTVNPKMILEDGNKIDLFHDPDQPAALFMAINTVVVDYKIDEIVVMNTHDQEMFEYLNGIFEYSHGTKLKITLQEN